MVVIPVIVLALLFGLLLHFTSFGRGVYEIGLSSEAAHFSGVNVARTKLLLFVMSGVVASLAGIYVHVPVRLRATDTGTGFELKVIASVLLGGVSIFGGRAPPRRDRRRAAHRRPRLRAPAQQQGLGDHSDHLGCLLVASVIASSFLPRVRELLPRRTPADRGQPTEHTADLRRRSEENERHLYEHQVQALRRCGSPDAGRQPRARRLRFRRRRRRRQRRRRGRRRHHRDVHPEGLGNPYFDTSDAGGEKAVGEFGGTYAEVGPDTAGPDTQVSFIDTAAQQGVNALVVSANDPQALCDSLNAARDAGTKVVTFDSDVDPTCRDLFINQAAGRGHRQGRGRHDRRADRRRR